MNEILTSNKDYVQRLGNAIRNKDKSLTQWWNYACAMKLQKDFDDEFEDPGIVSAKYGVPFEESEEFIAELESKLKSHADAFVQFKCTRNKDQRGIGGIVYDRKYKIDLKGFSISLDFEKWATPSVTYVPRLSYNTPTSKIKIKIWKLSASDVAEWLFRENETMPAFREKWEEHCSLLRDHMETGDTNEDKIKYLLGKKLAHAKEPYTIESGFNVQGRYIDLNCPSLNISFRIPGEYPRIMDIAEMFAEIIAQQNHKSGRASTS